MSNAQERKQAKIDYAISVADALNNSTDKYVRHKKSRPIYDLKQMLESSTALYGDLVAFHQRFAKDEPFKQITYKETYDTVNALGTALINRGLSGKRIAVVGENCYQWATSYLAVIWRRRSGSAGQRAERSRAQAARYRG